MQRTWGTRIKCTTAALIGATALLTAVQSGTAAAGTHAGVPTAASLSSPVTVAPADEDWN
ncbi:hypothetical protein [Streptomyces sp. NPDC057682]|uniref:hypothetical protein n=1 Tax=unclassified Streptomyces TaxID=2593676 RepID=UPI003648961B